MWLGLLYLVIVGVWRFVLVGVWGLDGAVFQDFLFAVWFGSGVAGWLVAGVSCWLRICCWVG